VRVAWLSLEDSDNDPVRFLAYLAAALHGADPDVGPEEHDVRLSAEATLTLLINDMSRGAHPTILFLDDVQLIEDPSVRDAIVFLLDHLPSTMHVAIASRSDPLLPLARLRASGDLTELRAADLRFTPDEAADFLKSATGLSLSREDVAALETRTEGWIAGLQLAALSMRETNESSSSSPRNGSASRTMRSVRACGASAATASPSGSSWNGTTITASGDAATATNCGSSSPPG
jgi:LuxR family maltose regulon positive regulatory protein